MTARRDLLPAVLLAAALLASFAAPSAARPLMFQGVALPLGLGLLALALLGPRPSADRIRLVAIAALPLLAFGLSALLAQNPLVSAVGLAGQRVGWLLWATAWVWFAAILFGGARLQTSLLAVVATTGVVASLATFADALGWLVAARRYSIEPAGLFESSISLGQFLVLAATCTAVLALRAQRGLPRTLSWSAFALAVGALTLSQSSGAWLAAGLGVLVAWSLIGGADRSGFKTWAARLTIALPVVALVGAWVVALAAPGSALFMSIDSVLNGRLTVWRSALLHVRDVWIAGVGPDQFSAWIEIRVRGSGAFAAQGAHDPHNLLLTILVTGGVLGAVAVAVTAFHVIGRVRRGDAADPSDLGRPVLLAGLWAVGVAALTAWLEPGTVICTAALVATLVPTPGDPGRDAIAGEDGVPASRPASKRSAATSAFALVPLLLGGAAVWLLAGGIVDEVAWAGSTSLTTLDTEARASLLDSPDPTYSLGEVRRLVNDIVAGQAPETALDEASSIVEAHAADATWHVDAALSLAEIRSTRAALRGEDTWAQVLEALEAGRRADPASPLWAYVGASQAAQLGRDDEAAALAAEALAGGATGAMADALEPLAD